MRDSVSSARRAVLAFAVVGFVMTATSAVARAQSTQPPAAYDALEARRALRPRAPAPQPDAPRALFAIGGAAAGGGFALWGGLGVDVKFGSQLTRRAAVYGELTLTTLGLFHEARAAAVFDVSPAPWLALGAGVFGAYHLATFANSAGEMVGVGVPLVANMLFGPTDPATGRRTGFHFGVAFDVGVEISGNWFVPRRGPANDAPLWPYLGGLLVFGYAMR